MRTLSDLRAAGRPVVVWGPDDVGDLRGAEEWGDARRTDFLARNRKHIEDAMVEAGWAALDTCLSMEMDADADRDTD
jgi:hypothetical protein